MVPVRLIGADQTSTANVSPEGVVHTVVHPHPPDNDDTIVLPYRAYFTTAAGSNDMAVNGGTTNVVFSVDASQDFDIFLKSISVVIGDGGAPALNKYGALAALANGVRWTYFTQAEGDYELHDGIKTNLEFVRVGVDTAGVGTGPDAFLADVSGGATEKSYLPVIDMAETFGMPYGLKLRKGTTDRVAFTVRDDLTGLTTHNAIGYGIRI